MLAPANDIEPDCSLELICGLRRAISATLWVMVGILLICVALMLCAAPVLVAFSPARPAITTSSSIRASSSSEHDRFCDSPKSRLTLLKTLG